MHSGIGEDVESGLGHYQLDGISQSASVQVHQISRTKTASEPAVVQKRIVSIGTSLFGEGTAVPMSQVGGTPAYSSTLRPS